MSYDNTNSGALFKNDQRRNENSPNARGSAEVQCPCCNVISKFWVSAWTKISKKNEPYQSLAFTPDDPSKSKPSPEAVRAALNSQGFDEDIPF